MRATAMPIRLPSQRPAARAPVVRPALPPAPRAPASLLDRWFRRREPTVYQRCLAVHIHYASPRSALS